MRGVKSNGRFVRGSDAGRRHSDGLGTRVPSPSVPEAPPPSPVQLNGKCVKLGSRLRRLTPLIRWASFQAETFLDPAAQHRGQGITCLSHKVGMDHFEGGGSKTSAKNYVEDGRRLGRIGRFKNQWCCSIWFRLSQRSDWLFCCLV